MLSSCLSSRIHLIIRGNSKYRSLVHAHASTWTKAQRKPHFRPCSSTPCYWLSSSLAVWKQKAGEAELFRLLGEADWESKTGNLFTNSGGLATTSLSPMLRSAGSQKPVPLSCFKSVVNPQYYLIKLDWGELNNGDSVCYKRGKWTWFAGHDLVKKWTNNNKR